MAVDIKGRGGNYMLGAWDGSPGHAYFTAITLLHGLFTFLTLAAMRTLFYELTSNAAFVSHRVAKRVIIGFDVIILGAGFALLFVTAFAGGPCCEGSLNTAGDMVMAGVFDATASYGFHYFVFAGEVLTIISSIFARKWARKYDLGVPMANAMLTVMTPLIVVKTILLIITTIVNYDGEIHGTAYLTFYVSIPWRFAQVATAGALAWIIRTRAVRSGVTDPAPKIQSTSRVVEGDLEK
ncbi:hypothetical protein EXIGLDRAFT_724652 [Exidia glandulosa HHB12029]|uniref:Uncharacterized protein n=1 Tax=Exidia glandulosa HHB12029 TaxID=1314781 RepID=A0A166BBF5_EXIGL|nr:hypothetical protein EXIGLDRAFT_724652 [Exidia glandulosa HHB12029]